MPEYRRNRVLGGTYFFTVNLLDRHSDLLVTHVDVLREAVRMVRIRRPFRIDAWVVLPDHMHAIWTLPAHDDDFSGRWKAIKIAFAKALPKTEYVSPVRAANGERGIWQRRFWEHTIRNDDDYAAHVDHVHIKPVKHGLVTKLTDWPCSSFHKFVARGACSPDWLGSGDSDLVTGERGLA